MPTPYGSRGGMAFGAEELRVLRRALAYALYPRPASPDDVQDFLHFAESVDEVVHEGARQRDFLLADLARYRAALPGSATGYYRLLEEALAAGHRPGFDDLAALRALGGNPAAAALLARCNALRAQSGAQDRPGAGRARPAPGVPRIPAAATDSPRPVDTGAADGAASVGRAGSAAAGVPAGAGVGAGSGFRTGGRVRLLALPGGLLDSTRALPSVAEGSGDEQQEPSEEPGTEREQPSTSPQRPSPSPAPGRQEPKPGRPIPTPGEVFPKRKPGKEPPSGPARQRLAAV